MHRCLVRLMCLPSAAAAVQRSGCLRARPCAGLTAHMPQGRQLTLGLATVAELTTRRRDSLPRPVRVLLALCVAGPACGFSISTTQVAVDGIARHAENYRLRNLHPLLGIPTTAGRQALEEALPRAQLPRRAGTALLGPTRRLTGERADLQRPLSVANVTRKCTFPSCGPPPAA